MPETLYLVPAGEVEGEILDYLCGQLEQAFGRSCQVAAPLPHPREAYNQSRKQYLSSHILQQLTGLELPDAFRALGVADLDLYVPELNFVFGQAPKAAGTPSSPCPACAKASIPCPTTRSYSASAWSKRLCTNSVTPSAWTIAPTGVA